MIDERIEQLMWQEIDGEISTEDKAELDAMLRDDGDARELFRELTAMAKAISPGDSVDPPAALHQRIEAAIDWDRYAQAPARSRQTRGGSGWIERLFPPGFGMRLVPAAAAAFLLGIIGYQLGLKDSATDSSHFYGAMVPAGEPAAQMQIDLETVSGTIGFREVDDAAIAEIALTSTEEVEVSFYFEGESLEFGALGQAGSPLQGISLLDNALTMTTRGANKYFFAFRNGPGPVSVRISSERGGVLFEDHWVPGRGE